MTISGASNGAIENNGALTVAECAFSDDSSTTYGAGGGIQNNGTLYVIGSAVLGRYGPVRHRERGAMTVVSSTFTGDGGDSGTGGGIFNDGQATIRSSGISNYSGGGVSNYGTLAISSTDFSYNEQGGISNEGTLSLVSCSFVNNAASAGGTIYNFFGQ